MNKTTKRNIIGSIICFFLSLLFGGIGIAVMMFRVGKCQYIRNTSLYKLTNGIENYRGVTIKVDYTRNDNGNYKWGEEITIGKTTSVFVSTKGIYAGSTPEYTTVKLYKNSTDVFVKVQSTAQGGSLTINSPLLIEESSVDVSTLTEVDWGKDVYCNYTSLSSLASALGGELNASVQYATSNAQGAATFTIPQNIQMNGLWYVQYPSYSGRVCLFAVQSETVNIVYASNDDIKNSITFNKNSTTRELTITLTNYNNSTVILQKV